MDIRKRILKGETKRLANRVLSEENADKVADFIFEDDNEDKNSNDTETIEINNTEESTGGESTKEDNSKSRFESWLDKKAEEADAKLEDTPDPVTDLEDMEKRIDELNSKVDEED